MIRLSMNVLSSAVVLLRRLDTYHFSTLAELMYSRIALVCAEDIFMFSNVCGWVREQDNMPELTYRGKELVNLDQQGLIMELRRQMLSDYILNASPVWSKRIPYGRKEAAIFMTDDERACFLEANLLTTEVSSDVVIWWDHIANQLRAEADKRNNDIGRIGEQLAVDYERVRTGVYPVWMSIDSNLAGYDIKSRVGIKNSAILLIEVKTSMQPLSKASFHISSHEWNVAATSTNYLLYLWCLQGRTRLLAAISPEVLRPYIPTNNSEGKWESAEIPFSCFESKFIEIV